MSQEKAQEIMTEERLNSVLNDADNTVGDIEIPRNKEQEIRIIRRGDFITRDLIVISVAIIGVCAMFMLTKPEIILTSVLSGLFGMSMPRKE